MARRLWELRKADLECLVPILAAGVSGSDRSHDCRRLLQLGDAGCCDALMRQLEHRKV